MKLLHLTFFLCVAFLGLSACTDSQVTIERGAGETSPEEQKPPTGTTTQKKDPDTKPQELGLLPTLQVEEDKVEVTPTTDRDPVPTAESEGEDKVEVVPTTDRDPVPTAESAEDKGETSTPDRDPVPTPKSEGEDKVEVVPTTDRDSVPRLDRRVGGDKRQPPTPDRDPVPTPKSEGEDKVEVVPTTDRDPVPSLGRDSRIRGNDSVQGNDRSGEMAKGSPTISEPKSPQAEDSSTSEPKSPQAEDSPTVSDPIVCSFPTILKQSLELKLNKPCHSITTQELNNIKQLKITAGSAGTQAKPSSADQSFSAYFPALESMDMSQNVSIQVLPEFIFDFNQLKNLNISHTGITDLSPQIAKLNQLEVLNISHTGITDLGPQIAKLKNLSQLNISQTKIKNLGPELCKLQKLSTLTGSHNTYEGDEMPLAIVCLSELKTLDLSYSSLKYIDEYIFYLKKLENLNLRGNHLMNLPAMLALLPSLITLDLRNNYFEYPSVNSLYDCSYLKKDSDERQECQEELLHDTQCEYWYKLHEDCSHIKGYDKEALAQKEQCEKTKFKRGVLGNESFIKRYEEMTGEKHVERYEGDEGHLKARCYYYWIEHYIFYNNPDDPREDPEIEFLRLKLHNHPNRDRIISEQIAKKHQYLLDLTINGKTIREWRLALDEMVKNSGSFLSSGRYSGCQYHIKGMSFRNTIEVTREDFNFKTARQAIPHIFRFFYHSLTDFGTTLYHFFIWPQNTAYGPSHSETHAERYRSLNWKMRPERSKTELCNPIDFRTPVSPDTLGYSYNRNPSSTDFSIPVPAKPFSPTMLHVSSTDFSIPVPAKPLGPWSKALPAVQTLIKENYLEPGWNECENWPTGQCYDWEERIERGENPGGFKKDYYAKQVEEKNKQRRINKDKLNQKLKEGNNGNPH